MPGADPGRSPVTSKAVARLLADLERENAALKRLLADAGLEKAALNEIASGDL